VPTSEELMHVSRRVPKALVEHVDKGLAEAAVTPLAIPKQSIAEDADVLPGLTDFARRFTNALADDLFDDVAKPRGDHDNRDVEGVGELDLLGTSTERKSWQSSTAVATSSRVSPWAAKSWFTCVYQSTMYGILASLVICGSISIG